MKHSFIFKFLAVILCAASLLGIVGSGLGILALSEANLYNKTVDQIIEERIQDTGTRMAQRIGGRYASMELGGIPETLAGRSFPDISGFLQNYGYALKDAEGNVLLSVDRADTQQTYTFPIEGQYMHLVSLEEEAVPEETIPAPNVTYSVDATIIHGTDYYIYDAIPSQGTFIHSMEYTLHNGSTGEYSGESIGYLHYLSEGSLMFSSNLNVLHYPPQQAIQEIYFWDNTGSLVYQAYDTVTGVGYFDYDPNGNVVFFSSLEPPVEQTVPETLETVPETVETVPETIPETVPETVPETQPIVTEPPIQFDLEDNVPDEHSVEVVQLSVTLSDGEKLSHEDEEGIGRILREEDKTITFTSYEYVELIEDNRTVTDVRFLNKDGGVILAASSPDGVGNLYYDEDSHLVYHSDFPEIPEPAAETVPPETAAETIPPETVAETLPPETVPETVATETVPAVTEPIIINGKPLRELDIIRSRYEDLTTGKIMIAQYVYVPMPEYTLELYIGEDPLVSQEFYDILRLVRPFREYLLPILGACVAAFVIFAVYLCFTAGRKPKSTEIRAGGLNRIPLDLYLFGGGMAVIGLCIGASEGSMYLLRSDMRIGIACAASCAYGACLLVVGFLYACVAQGKMKDGFWWRNTLCGHFFRLFFRSASRCETWLEETGFPILWKWLKKLWSWCLASLIRIYKFTEKLLQRVGDMLRKGFRWFSDQIRTFLSMLPVTWQWLLIGGFMILFLWVASASHMEFGLFLALLFAFAMVLYGSHCFGELWEATKKMNKGDLDTKVDDKLMVGAFADFAKDLNALADVAVVAAQKQLKSERMKTELITNVSHDIKTPLTSIINYVDLLQKPHTEEEETQYLEVLERQSQRLKKLIDDLMDMSKASTGNMTVDITKVDAVESVNQALGEFADKLDRAQLYPVFRHAEESVPMMADGRLVWRVLSNLLSNAVKYALPGTRLYVDLARLDGNVVISLKNISREELNMDAAELMERFVRGDDSRNTEGSGLGLNIAKSLMDLQNGQMELLVDGDLFKVTLIFPGV